MHWLIFALLSPLTLTVVNFADKYIVERRVHDPRAMVIYAGIVGAIWGAIFMLWTGVPALPVDTVLLILLRGGMVGFAAALYFQAMKAEQASSIVMLLQAAPIPVLVLSYIFLGETISAAQFAGFALVISATMGLSLARTDEGGGLQLSAAFFYIMGTNLIVASALVLGKDLVDNNPLKDIIGYESWGLALGTLVMYALLPAFRSAFNESINLISTSTWVLIFISESLFTLAKLLSLIAQERGGPISLVSVLFSTQVFFAIVFGWVLTTLAPATFREDIARSSLVRKGVYALVLVGGVVLISL